MTLPYRVKFSLGDWSDDGHGKCDHFFVRTSAPVEDLRELHFKCNDVFGFNPGNLCREYEQHSLTPDQIAKLLQLGVIDQDDVDDDGDVLIDTLYLLGIWLKMLQRVDPTLQYEIETEDGTPSMHFGGFDDQGRHIDVPGYGCFV